GPVGRELALGAGHGCLDECSEVIDAQPSAKCSVRAFQNNPVPRPGRMKVPLSFDDRHIGITKPDLVAGIDDGAASNCRGVAQVALGDICPGTESGFVAADSVGNERVNAFGGVATTVGVAPKRIKAAGSVAVADAVGNERVNAVGGVVEADGVE